MSSDGYFDDDDLNDAAFEELDAIEASHKPHELPQEPSFDSDDYTFGEIDERELERLDAFIEDSYQGKAQPVAGPSRTSSHGSLQMTLFGDILPPSAPKGPARTQIQRTKSTPRNPFGQQAPKTKKWDHTAFSKSGVKRGKSKGKGKAMYDDNNNEEEEDVEFEQFPAPFVSIGCPPPMKLKPDLLEAKHWIYPLNQPKRDYQYNIVKHCLFENTIVALPTGLGKTFVAGVVMLNFYRWFPEGKVVFVAPTKPLVAQQIDACHKTCGIPGSDAVELTGQNPKAMRARAWKEKRVFYMTPQTLNNDLVSKNCDAGDIVLLVIDEAHRATGGYAYNEVVRYMMATNPHFRILALTATPGGDPDAVQALVDGLHISRIEIRDENSLDLKAYIHHKKIEQHVIKMSEDIDKVKDALVILMNARIRRAIPLSILKPLQQRGVMHAYANPINMHTFGPQARMKELKPDQKWAYAPLSKLSALARAMGYLIEGTIGMCYTLMHGMLNDTEGDGDGGAKKNASKAKKLRDDPKFQAVIKELELQRLRGFSIHPKMERLKGLVVQHFAEKLGEDGKESEETKVMVFVTFREAVDEIVEALNFERPLIRAHRFIGQGTDKRGEKGLAQKAQLEVIKKFKAGEFNVLVATSIGEEGLDIGEVDLIICYDAQKTPIRMLQRFGRTGRKREGTVHVLLSEGREEFNMDKARVTYKEVQKTIVRGDQLELYLDVERLLPDYVKPECLEKVMEIQEYVREEGRKKRSSSKERVSPRNGTKRKRNDDISRNIPDGASTGFISVAKLLVKGSKKRKKVSEPKNFDQAGQDDDTDMEIESGIVGLPRRAASSAASTSTVPVKVKTKMRRAATDVGTKRTKKTKAVEPTPSQFASKVMDESDDIEIERGGILRASTSRQKTFPDQSPRRRPSPSGSTAVVGDVVVVDSDSDSAVPPCEWVGRHLYHLLILCSGRPPSPRRASPAGPSNMAWLLDEDDEPDIEIYDSSPALGKRSRQNHSPELSDDSMQVVSMKSAGKRRAVTPIDFGPDQSVEFVEPLPSKKRSKERIARFDEDPEDSMNVVSDDLSAQRPNFTPSRPPAGRKLGMPPPDLPARLFARSPPQPSFPVRGPGRVARRRVAEPESPADIEMPAPSQRRLQRKRDVSPSRNAHRRMKTSAPTGVKRVYDFEAVHSGDEVSEGSSGSDDEESESDRQFLANVPETQVSPSYDQSLAYRQSLLTQAPGGGRIPAFANRPARTGMFAGGLRESSRRRPFVSSSPPQEPDDEPDAYAIGSFVVDDDDDISFLFSET
ncbi:hypothetical protein B0H10DRAFT_1780302 [Mycena sp. CBHHK59/15]|nr:hypothetical protein B0H10DRAFT_1780302 [Mycena sp. CBHHK59/15]